MIYFIQSDQYVKIGWCGRDPIRRLEKLQIGNPIKLKLVALMDGDYAAEQNLHCRLHKLRVRGEWFKLEGPVSVLIKRHAVDHADMSRRRPARVIEGFPAHLIYANIEKIAAAEAAGVFDAPKP